MHPLFDYLRPVYENETLTEIELFNRFTGNPRIVVLTGAGVSAESKIPTFRGKGGIWDSIDINEVGTAQALARNPGKVWRWLDEMRTLIATCNPNHAHVTLADMETVFDDFHLVTQNIDGLHQLAGSRSVIELHGNIWQVRCTADGTVSEYRTVPAEEYPPHCDCGAILRPDVVFFNEPLPEGAITRAVGLAGNADIMLVVGTSAVVQPAATLPMLAVENNATIVEFNLERTPVTPLAHYSYFGKAGKTMRRFWKRLRATR